MKIDSSEPQYLHVHDELEQGEQEGEEPEHGESVVAALPRRSVVCK